METLCVKDSVYGILHSTDLGFKSSQTMWCEKVNLASLDSVSSAAKERLVKIRDQRSEEPTCCIQIDYLFLTLHANDEWNQQSVWCPSGSPLSVPEI